MASEDQSACSAIHTEHCDVVAPLVAGIEELAGGVEIEAAWVVSACPCFPNGKRSLAYIYVACSARPLAGGSQYPPEWTRTAYACIGIGAKRRNRI